MYCLDTNICIEFLHGRLPYAYHLMRQSDHRLFKLPSPVVAELLLGMRKREQAGENVEKQRWLLDEFLLPFEVLPFDGKCAETYAQVRAAMEAKGTLIGPNDLIIAATALANNAVLVTNNVREFKRVPGLSLESWEEVPLDS